MKNLKKVALFAVLFLSIAIFTSCASIHKQKSVLQTPLKMDAAIVQGKLDNGMSYYVRKNGEPKNRIVLRLVVNAGSNMEDDDQRGVAHFIEHLAFNGTENFEKSAIVDYFEKIGMDFGSDLNAYTTFDETVYKLEIPADDPEILRTALLILHDWACAINFPEAEIEKERGVVTEEWRLRQGLQGRITEKIIPLLLKDSRYEKRQPIGDMEIIKSIGRERILDFYKKWYRPELMSVVAVGDIEVDVLENAIKEAMESIPASLETVKSPKFDVPVQKDKNISMLIDAEQKYEVIQLFQQREGDKPNKTEEDLRSSIALDIARQVLNTRLFEKASSAETNWLEAFATDLNYTHTSAFEYQGVVPKSGKFEAGFKDFLDELDRFVIFGVTKSEVERIKTTYLTNLEQSYKNKDKISSSTHADNLVGHCVTDSVVISQEDNYRIIKNLIPQITIEEINSEVKKYYSNRETLMFVQAPANADDVLSESEIMNLWTEYKNEVPLQPYEDEETGDELMERPSVKGKIVSKKEISEMDVKEYIFENGIKFYTKKTDFVENKIQMQAVSYGGLYAIPENQVPSAKYSASYRHFSGMKDYSYNQFMKSINTKNFSYDYDINLNTEYFSGTSTNEDFEALLQTMYQIFTDFKFTQEGWTLLQTNLTETAKNHGMQPRDVFLDEIIKTLYGDDIYHAPLDLSYVEKMNAEMAAATFKNRFDNPADFTYVFVGDFDEDNLIELLSYYLGSLKTSKNREKLTYRITEFPKGINQKNVYKGLDEQGQVYIGFGGKIPQAKDLEEKYYEEFMASELNSLLNIWLRESIREDKSGCYGIGAFGGIEGNTERCYEYEINFGCNPKRAEELTQEVLTQIKKLQTEEIPQDYIEKLQETLRRSREINLRHNGWWITRITQQLIYENQPIWVSQDVEKIISWITPEALQQQAKKYLNTENYVSVYLKPEK